MYSPSYVHETRAKKRRNLLLQILFSLALGLFIIGSSAKFTLMFKPLYYFDIEYLHIVEQSNFTKGQIIENYDYVTHYLLSPKEQEFKLPSIPYSEHGAIHFKDVKKIFRAIDILLIITGVISIIGCTINIKYKNFKFLKYTSCILAAIPIVLLTAFTINFDAFFTIFHGIFFSNDYWLFNRELDPIINMLPQEFFFHAALLIVIIIILSIMILSLLYRKLGRINK